MIKHENNKLLLAIGKRVTYMRNLRGMSQLDLSVEAGVGKNYICDVENGRRNLSIKSLSKISKALNTTLSDLLKGIDNL